MKKILAVAFVLVVLVPSFALSEIDLTGMTYDELVALKDQINLAMWNSQEWQEVEVPQGVWVVGEDIPAGRWTVKSAENWRKTDVSWGEYLSESKESIAWTGAFSLHNNTYNPNHKYYKIDDGITEYSFTVEDGMFVIIEDGPAVFTPYTGKPSLGFK